VKCLSIGSRYSTTPRALSIDRFRWGVVCVCFEEGGSTPFDCPSIRAQSAYNRRFAHPAGYRNQQHSGLLLRPVSQSVRVGVGSFLYYGRTVPKIVRHNTFYIQISPYTATPI
jgi:hypothetical protein